MVCSGWGELTRETTPPIMLLVCVQGDEGVSGDGVGGDGVRDEVEKWCVGKGVEMVEWSPDKTTQEKEEEEEEEEEEDGMFTAPLLYT